MPSGINPSLGCSPILGCTAKDYYLPGKGVWAPKPMFGRKSTIGAAGGAIAGAYWGAQSGDPLITAASTVGGLVVGHEIGAHFDKVDQIHATMLLKQTLHTNQDGQLSTWQIPDKGVTVTQGPVATNGNCREFVSNVQIGKDAKQIRGTACMINNEWVEQEVY